MARRQRDRLTPHRATLVDEVPQSVQGKIEAWARRVRGKKVKTASWEMLASNSTAAVQVLVATMARLATLTPSEFVKFSSARRAESGLNPV